VTEPADLAEGDVVTASIDLSRRAAIARHHTATHVLHWALREVLGDHVKQQGSWVGPDRLRFDFSHYEALTDDQIIEIEDLVNKELLSNAAVNHFETTIEDATERGAIAFFGDKYGDRVRVLEAGTNSIELCGGTHVSALGDIGLLTVISEGSIGSNLRRIEAAAGSAPIDRLRTTRQTLRDASEILGVGTADVVDAVQRQQQELKSLRSEIERLNTAAAVGRAGELAAGAEDGIVIAQIDGIDRDGLRELAVAIRDEGVALVVLGTVIESGGAALVSAADPGGRFDAGEALGDAGKMVTGGGRPNPELTIIGGKDGSAIGEALDHVRANVAT
jgi:alanyl-tRNA synthetase